MTTQTKLVNGVDLEQLVGTVDVIKENPEVAQFKFRAETEWIDGGYSRTTIQDFYGACQEDTSRTEPFVLEGDEPPVLLGANKAPNAVETVLAALASCLSVGMSYNAAAQGIKLEKLSFRLEGDIDLHGFLGLSDEVRPGFQAIRVTCDIVSDATPEQVAELCAYVHKTSPVLDMISNSVPVMFCIDN